MSVGSTGRPVAAITGASSGFGKIYAERLAQKGCDIVMVARRADKLNAVAEEIRKKYNVETETIVADLAVLSDVERVEKRIEEIPTLEYMINNAGFGGDHKFPDVDVDVETRMILTHCVASMRLSRAALIPMRSKGKKKGAGYIVNVASIAGFLAGSGAADYCGTKAFLITFSKCLQCDAKEFGVRVQALCPGFANTGFHTSETMIDSQIKKKYPEFLWDNAEYIVDRSLRVLHRPCRVGVVFIPRIFYKLVGYFGSSWLFAPLRLFFSCGSVR
ncbi:MAG: SDR family NAD(P)-dependent oxidoreductase [Thermoguttaceae bacterium]|jgi:short-subunit dehydrogenase